MSNQLDLYQQVILEHNRKPRNFGKLADASHQGEGYNPLCGDHLWIYLKLSGEKMIEDIRFDGSGCAISKASASMMTSALKGKSAAEAMDLFEEFQSLLRGELDPQQQPHQLGKLKIFASIWQFPSRIKCAGLAWHTLRGALVQGEQQVVSTE